MKQKWGKCGLHAISLLFEKCVGQLQVQNVIQYFAVALLAMFCTYHLKISHPFEVHLVSVGWLFSVQRRSFFGLEGKSEALVSWEEDPLQNCDKVSKLQASPGKYSKFAYNCSVLPLLPVLAAAVKLEYIVLELFFTFQHPWGARRNKAKTWIAPTCPGWEGKAGKLEEPQSWSSLLLGGHEWSNQGTGFKSRQEWNEVQT